MFEILLRNQGRIIFLFILSSPVAFLVAIATRKVISLFYLAPKLGLRFSFHPACIAIQNIPLIPPEEMPALMSHPKKLSACRPRTCIDCSLVSQILPGGRLSELSTLPSRELAFSASILVPAGPASN